MTNSFWLIIIFVIIIIVIIVLAVTMSRKKESADRVVSRKHVHDIRSALSVIKTQSEVALLKTDMDIGTQDVLKNNIKEVNRASVILNELLN